MEIIKPHTYIFDCAREVHIGRSSLEYPAGKIPCDSDFCAIFLIFRFLEETFINSLRDDCILRCNKICRDLYKILKKICQMWQSDSKFCTIFETRKIDVKLLKKEF